MTLKRIPFTGAYNTRPGTLALTGTSGVCGIAVCGVSICGKTNQPSDKDHRLINCFHITETDQNAQTKRIYIVKRAGPQTSNTPNTGHVGNAIHVWNGQGTGTKIMSAIGNTDFALFDGTTLKGSGTGKATAITETSVSGTPTLTISSTDSTGWYYQDGGSVTKISDSDYPGNASRTTTGPIVHMDGYAFQMDTTTRVYNSDLNSVTAWTANSYLTANSMPDVGVACWRHRDLIIGFCKEHLDIFRNVGNPTGSPLRRIDELSQKIGCINQDAITEVRDQVYFIGSTKGSNLALYSFNGGEITKHSKSEIEAALSIAGPTNITITKLGMYGRHFVVICASSSTYAYCIEEDSWSEWSGIQLWYKADGVGSGSSIVNYMVSKAIASGKVYVLNPANIAYTDDGNTLTATIQTAKLDMGTARHKFWHRLDVIGDQQTAASTLSIAWSDDDYQTTSSPRTVDLSVTRPNLTRCGRSRRRSYLLAHSANTAMRVEALELDFEVGLV